MNKTRGQTSHTTVPLTSVFRIGLRRVLQHFPGSWSVRLLIETDQDLGSDPTCYHWRSLQPGHHEDHLIWVDSSPLAPIELAWFWVPLAACLNVQPPVWPFWEPSDLSGLNQNSLPWLAVLFPLCVSLWGRWCTVYYLWCIYCIFCILTRFSFLSFVQSNLSVKMLVFS
jgi:hypothetical protein